MGNATVTVVYPSEAKFDMDYYLKTHMPLVQKNWGSYGLKSWKVLKFEDPKAPYGVQATLEFDDMSSFEKAAGGPEAKTVLGDIPNFSDKEPVILAGKVLATS